MGRWRVSLWVCVIVFLACPGFSQVIEFESNGLKYQTLTRSGLTIMVAWLPAHVRDYSVLQVAVSNGGTSQRTIRPDDFRFLREDGTAIPAATARNVVNSLIDRASRSDVIKLITAYENGIFANVQYKATNGYEQRRQSALAEFTSTRLRAAAAASAIAFVQTKLAPGQSTDGAVFYPTPTGRPLGPGVVEITASGDTYRFPTAGSVLSQ